MKFFLQALAWLMLCATTTAFAALPDRVEASYEVSKSGLDVEVREIYTRDKDRYTLASVWTPVGLLALIKPEKIFIDSSGLIGKQGLQPLLLDHRRERDQSKNSRAEFDWSNKRLTLITPAQHKVVDLPEGTQDRLSMMYQFMFLPLDADTLGFPMTNGSKLDHYRYSVTRGQTVRVPAGEFKAIYLESQSKPGESRTEIWLAAEHHNLPCKVIITEANGDRYVQVLSKLETRP